MKKILVNAGGLKRMNIIKSKKGQGSALSSDLPAIVMIVVSVSFFLSSLAYSLTIFEEGKDDLLIKRAAVEAATAFIKESAKINIDDVSSPSSFWQQRIEGMQTNYGVNIYAELITPETDFLGSLAWCDLYTEQLCYPKCIVAGEPAPSESRMVMVKSFPIAAKKTDLCVFPGIIKVTIWK